MTAILDATPLFRLYARRRQRILSGERPAEVQQRVLLDLLTRAASTRFGGDHGFARLSSVAAFQQAVPLRRYEAFWDEYWQPAFPVLENVSWPGRIPYFAFTSGTTTGVTKNLPVSGEMTAANRRAALDVIVQHLLNRPQSHVFGGKTFMLGGSTALEEEAPGVWSGDLSGIAASAIPWWARPFTFPPRKLEAISDWEEKIAAFATAARGVDIRCITGVPSWMLILFEQMTGESGGAPLAEVFPNLELVVHGGVNFAPYRDLFAEKLAGSGAETREVYPASEGFIAVADRGDGEGLRMILDNGLFYEFVPVEELESAAPTRHWIANADTDVNYALVVSSNAGLWAYVLGDTVRLIDRDPPRLLITGRTSYMLSAFGEHLIGEEIEAAVATAAEAIDRNVTDWSVGPVFPHADSERGGHLYIVEFADGVPDPDNVDRFTRAIDEDLCKRNDDYRVHRSGDYGMRAPVVRPVAPGTFADWMKAHGRLGGQNKVPRVITDDDVFADLRNFAGANSQENA